MIKPVFISLKNWASSLVIDFPNDNIPTLISEDEWKKWGDDLLQCNSFLENSVPSTSLYENWNDWSMNVFYLMENNS